MTGLVDRIAGFEYGLKKPQSLIVCVPLVAQLVQYVQLNRIPKPANGDGMLAYAEKVDPINIYHAIGALIRSVAWIALAFFTGNPLFAFCAAPALYQAYRSSQNLVHSYTYQLPARDDRLQIASQNPNALAVAPANARGAQPGWLSRIGTAISRAFAPTAIDPQWVRATLDRAMAEIKGALLRQTDYPNKTLIGVRIEGRGVEPFVGAMNLNLTEAPRAFAWHATLHQRMQEYLTKNRVTKFEIALGIGTSPEAGHYNICVMDKSLELEGGGMSSSFGYSSYEHLSVEGIRALFQAHPALLTAVDRVEGVFGNNAVANVW
ncbi:MAG TPA: hypothetical protein VGM34_01720 [Chlamydiales bacterium]|jgi:hypothetical protein